MGHWLTCGVPSENGAVRWLRPCQCYAHVRGVHLEIEAFRGALGRLAGVEVALQAGEGGSRKFGLWPVGREVLATVKFISVISLYTRTQVVWPSSM